MKKTLIIAFGLLGIVLTIGLMAFKTPPVAASQPYILIEIYEIPSYPDRGVHIHYGNNKREFIPFPGMDVEHHDEAGDITLQAINKLQADGYVIESTAAGLTQAGMITKVFMRKR
jgi:hypothetical protein